MHQYNFTNDWFQNTAQKTWDILIPSIDPKTILEIGSYEGASATYLVEKLSQQHPLELHCIDTWEGSAEHIEGTHSDTANIDMKKVEARFSENINIALKSRKNVVNLIIHKGESYIQLSRLIEKGFTNYFDFCYVDGSHQACDVLTDAVLTFKLTKSVA